MTRQERSEERNAGLEREDQAERMRWDVYKQTPNGWAVVRAKDGKPFGAWGYSKALRVLNTISEKPWNKGVAFRLLNNNGQNLNDVLFGSH
jgi:hypothetical protein